MRRGLTLLKKLRWLMAFMVVGACVDPIHFDAGEPRDLIIIEGTITDDPGPYTLKMFRGLKLDSDTSRNIAVPGAKIVLRSDQGESEQFTEEEPGVYRTGGAIQGRIGNSYHVTIEMTDGATFKSTEEQILPSGQVTEIRYQYEARIEETTYGDLPADVFNIFVDADGAGPRNDPSFVRWRFRGTYVTATNPELHETYLQGELFFKTPYPCSGYTVDPAIGGGTLRQVTECACCTCYVTQYETVPTLSDNDLVSGGQFRNLKVAEVPISRATFYEKYKVEIEQMTISKKAFDFFKLIRTQKLGASNLFQPPPGKLVGNIVAEDANYSIIGLFWAASIHRKSIFIRESDVPYKLPEDVIKYPCMDIYANSSVNKPADWDE